MCAVKWILTSLPKLAYCRSSYTGVICLPFSFSRWPACLATSPCLSHLCPQFPLLGDPSSPHPTPTSTLPTPSLTARAMVFCASSHVMWITIGMCPNQRVCIRERERVKEGEFIAVVHLGSRVRRKRRGGSLLEGVCVCVWAGIYAVILWLRCGNKSNPFALLDTSFGKLGWPSVGRIRESLKAYFHQIHGLKIMVVESTSDLRTGASGSKRGLRVHSVLIWSRGPSDGGADHLGHKAAIETRPRC